MTVTPIPRPQEVPWMESKTDGLREHWICEYDLYLRTEHRDGVETWFS